MYFYLFRSVDHRACHLKPIAFSLAAEIDKGANRHYFSAKRFQVMAVKFSISLTDEQHRFAKELVEAGRYSSVSAVRQQGIDLLR